MIEVLSLEGNGGLVELYRLVQMVYVRRVLSIIKLNNIHNYLFQEFIHSKNYFIFEPLELFNTNYQNLGVSFIKLVCCFPFAWFQKVDNGLVKLQRLLQGMRVDWYLV